MRKISVYGIEYLIYISCKCLRISSFINLKTLTNCEKIEYEEPIGKLSELDDLYIAKMKEVLKERGIYGILFENYPPHLSPVGVYYGANEPDNVAWMLKFEQGFLADIDQQRESDWTDYFADKRVWMQVEDLMDEDDEFNFSGGRAYLYDDIYDSICRAINECADEE